MEKQKLMQLIEQHLAANPEDAPEMLDAVKNGLLRFRTAEETRRSHEAQTAILHLMGMFKMKRKDDRQAAISGAHVVPFHFPKGFIGPYAKLEIDFLEEFCERYFAAGDLHLSNWEATQTKGHEYFTMLKEQWEQRKAL